VGAVIFKYFVDKNYLVFETLLFFSDIL